MKALAVLAVKAYRATLSPFTGASCRYHPSCSHYSEEAFRRHGFLHGALLTMRRLARCQPLGGRGYDPVP